MLGAYLTWEICAFNSYMYFKAYCLCCSMWAQVVDRRQQHTVIVQIPLAFFVQMSLSANHLVHPDSMPMIRVLAEDTTDIWINVSEPWLALQLPPCLPPAVLSLPPGGGIPSKRLMEMCRWMGSHFHSWVGYNGVTHFWDFWDKKILLS